jgi:hypothetical protein
VEKERREKTYQLQSRRPVSSCAVHSLPSSSAEAARVHAAHVAHADDSDALVRLHGDDGGGKACVSGLNFHSLRNK